MATIALTCKLSSFLFMTETIHDLVDPGCIAAYQSELRNQESSVRIAKTEINGFSYVMSEIEVPKHITQGSKGAILKAYCKELGTTCCGSKAVMWASILTALQARRADAENRYAVMLRVVELCPIRRHCPIRSRVRLLLQALQQPNATINAKDAMTLHRLTKAILENIPRIHWSVRVYKLVHVLRAAILQHGESHCKYVDAIEQATHEYNIEREAKRRHEEEEGNNVMRREQFDNLLIKHRISESGLRLALQYYHSDPSTDDSSSEDGNELCDTNINGFQTITSFLQGRSSMDISRVEYTIIESLVIHARIVELNDALVAVGCEIGKTECHVCDDYISYDHGTVHEIVEIMREMKWYLSETEYEKMAKMHRDTLIREVQGSMYGYGGRYNIGRYKYGRIRLDANKKAKETALVKWLSGYEDINVAISQPNLPPSIIKMVKTDHAFQVALKRFVDTLAYSTMDISPVLSRKCAERFAHEVSRSVRTNEDFSTDHAQSMQRRIKQLTHKYDMIKSIVESDGTFPVNTFVHQFTSEHQFLTVTEADINSKLVRMKQSKIKKRRQKK